MLKTVLVALDGSPFSDTGTALALDWGVRFGAHLIGLAIVDEPSINKGEAVPMGAGEYKKSLDRARLADAHERVAGFLSIFRDRCDAASVPVATLEETGDPTRCILKNAHRSDLVVLGYETHFHFETQDSPDTVRAKILRRSPRPIVVVPRSLPEGTGVVVAWGGGREVARTLQMLVLLGMAGNETIHLVGVTRGGDQVDSSAGLAAEFLRAHGASCAVHIEASMAAPGRILLDRIREIRPRLVVMGAHAHHAIRGLFESSVVRAVLRECPVPVLVGS